jgi:hypothetical protein
LELSKSATLQSWKLENLGTLQDLGALSENIATLQLWDLLLGQSQSSCAWDIRLQVGLTGAVLEANGLCKLRAGYLLSNSVC